MCFHLSAHTEGSWFKPSSVFLIAEFACSSSVRVGSVQLPLTAPKTGTSDSDWFPGVRVWELYRVSSSLSPSKHWDRLHQPAVNNTCIGDGSEVDLTSCPQGHLVVSQAVGDVSVNAVSLSVPGGLRGLGRRRVERKEEAAHDDASSGPQR